MEALAHRDPQVKLRRIDIGSWHSAVASQYQIDRLPMIWLYEDGELVSRETGESLARLERR